MITVFDLLFYFADTWKSAQICRWLRHRNIAISQRKTFETRSICSRSESIRRVAATQRSSPTCEMPNRCFLPLALHTAHLLMPVPLPKRRAVRNRIFSRSPFARCVQKLELQLDYWSKKYEDDTEQKDKELSQLKQSKARDLEKLQDLTRKACIPPSSCRAHRKSPRNTEFCTWLESKSLQSRVEFQFNVHNPHFPQWSHNVPVGVLMRWWHTVLYVCPSILYSQKCRSYLNDEWSNLLHFLVMSRWGAVFLAIWHIK